MALGKSARDSLKNNQGGKKKAWGVVQAVQGLSSEHKALCSNPTTTTKKKKKVQEGLSNDSFIN
jgi:hypothetical protein